MARRLYSKTARLTCTQINEPIQTHRLLLKAQTAPPIHTNRPSVRIRDAKLEKALERKAAAWSVRGKVVRQRLDNDRRARDKPWLERA